VLAQMRTDKPGTACHQYCFAVLHCICFPPGLFPLKTNLMAF
jgi:hypothetical protein